MTGNPLTFIPRIPVRSDSERKFSLKSTVDTLLPSSLLAIDLPKWSRL